jgi:hypothetical protein
MTTFPKPLLDGQRRDFPISNLWETALIDATMPDERRLMNLVLPPWQRPEVWSLAQKQKFIEGIFLGFGTGYYVVNGANWDDVWQEGVQKTVALPMSGWLLDGQQRITAIRDFVAGEFAIFDGIRYPDMSLGDRRKRFDNVVFPCVVIEYTGDEQKLLELYRRLNYGGTAHSAQDREQVELRQAELNVRLTELLARAATLLDEVRGTINLERGFANEMESNVATLLEDLQAIAPPTYFSAERPQAPRG